MLSRLIHNSTGSGMVIVATDTDWASHLAFLATNSPNTPLCPVVIKLQQFKGHAESGDRW